jgi:hypothetical protein
MRAQIEAASDSDWKPLLNSQEKKISGQDTYRTSFCIGGYEKPFTLIVQRTAIEGQASLDLGAQDNADEINLGRYVYRAIATNQEALNDSEIIHWYNQRGEDSENRIKELKLDFGGDTLPCSDFNANALYFLISALSYNVFALMRQLLPQELVHHRAKTLRWRLFAIAAKVVRTGRQLWVKMREDHRVLLDRVLTMITAFKSPPI